MTKKHDSNEIEEKGNFNYLYLKANSLKLTWGNLDAI